jgi:hypothetical protein
MISTNKQRRNSKGKNRENNGNKKEARKKKTWNTEKIGKEKKT